jgi:hypothetical protein
MLRQYKPIHFFKTVASSAAPEFLSEEAGLRLHGVTFIAEKTAGGGDNTGNVTIMLGGTDAKVLEPGREWSWPQPPHEAGWFDPKDFKIKVATNGDGVHVFANKLL